MKILCPNHKDTNPSMHLYEERGYCFVCGYTCPVEEVASPTQMGQIKKEKTDVDEMLQYISELPVREHRGLQFPTNSTGFYVVYPNAKFYKKRLFEGRSRYIGPRGHKVPLYVHEGKSDDVVIVEGEINARTLFEARVTIATIASPGSSTEMLTHLDKLLTHCGIFAIVVDRDVPGVAWGLKLKSELLKRGRRVILAALEKDYNQILQEEGFEKVKEVYRKEVGL